MTIDLSNPSTDQSYKFHYHPWHMVRNRSLIDTIFKWVLGAIAFTLPLEGALVISGERTVTFFLSILAIGIALFRLPGVVKNFFRATGLFLLSATFIFGITLYFLNPLRGAREIQLVIQLIAMATMFAYVADVPECRKQLMWLYWAGWFVFVTFSLIQVLTGAGNIRTFGEDMVRISVFNYSLAYQSSQVNVGLILALHLTFVVRQWYLRAFVIASTVIGSFSIFFSGNRGALLSLIAALLLWAIIQNFARKRRDEEHVRSLLTNTITAIVLILGVFTIFTQTEIGFQLLDSMTTRLELAIDEGDIAGRDVLFNAGLDIAANNPLGVGFGNSMAYVAHYLSSGREADVHNYYLRMLIEVGVLGFAVFVAGILITVWRGFRWFLVSRDVFFIQLLFMLLVSSTTAVFHYKILWFFIAMNALTPLNAQKRALPEQSAKMLDGDD